MTSHAVVPDLFPEPHMRALHCYFNSLNPPSVHPIAKFHTSLLSIYSTLSALLIALGRPITLINQINSSSRSLSRNYSSLSRSTRWPLGLMDVTRQRLDREKEEKVRKEERELEDLGKELRVTQTTVAGDLAGWQEWRAQEARRAVRELVRGMVVLEKGRLEGLRRAVRRVGLTSTHGAVVDEEASQQVAESSK
jgi:hypothetical protein